MWEHVGLNILPGYAGILRVVLRTGTSLLIFLCSSQLRELLNEKLRDPIVPPRLQHDSETDVLSQSNLDRKHLRTRVKVSHTVDRPQDLKSGNRSKVQNGISSWGAWHSEGSARCSLDTRNRIFQNSYIKYLRKYSDSYVHTITRLCSLAYGCIL